MMRDVAVRLKGPDLAEGGRRLSLTIDDTPVRMHFGVGEVSESLVAESTQRSRSFLFAAIGLAVAEMFSLDRFTFFENGVVSLNLPPVGQVVGARATRTTHPKFLNSLTQLFSAILDSPREDTNPYLFRTKAEVVETIDRLGFSDQIASTHSCADVHNKTRMHSHCGRCSQCIDRRFAIQALGLEKDDPAEAYAVDLLTGARTKVSDREMVLSYVRNARFYAHASPFDLLVRYPELTRALNETQDAPSEVLRRLHALQQRHGRSVSGVMEKALSAFGSDQVDPNSLLVLYREAQLADLAVMPVALAEPKPEVVDINLDRGRKTVELKELGTLSGASYRLLDCLATVHLGAAGEGHVMEDYPCIGGVELAERLGLADEDSARRSIKRTRGQIADLQESAGLTPTDLIETIPPYGYRLAPDRVRVTVARTSAPAKD